MELKSGLVAVVCALGMNLAAAQGTDEFPSRPITMIVPFPAGSAADTAGRVVAERMSASLGARVVVDNRPGASGAPGTAAGARAAPDAYTMTMVASPAVIAMQVMPNPGFNLTRDFAPVGGINDFYNVLVASQKLGIKTFQDFLAHARSNPGRLNLASAGDATPSDIGGRALARRHALDVTVVPYRGSTPALNAVVSGEADAAILPAGLAMPHIKSGRLSALAVTAPRRLDALPDVPDTREAGADVVTSGWTGLAVPTGSPPARIAILNKALNQALATEGVKENFRNSGASAIPGTPDDLSKVIERDIQQTRDMLTSK